MLITFPDGTTKEYNQPMTLIQIAKDISPSLAKKTISGYVNDKLFDNNIEITSDSTIKLITTSDSEAFSILNHSTAHLLAQAIQKLYPDVKFSIGPAIEEGFYYDIDLPETISNKELIKIEKEMVKLTKKNDSFVRKEITYQEAQELFANNSYKLYLIEKIKSRNEKITIYSQGDFVDLCQGIHVGSTNKIKHFKLLSVAGAYWLGDSKNKMLQRIYGTSWFTKEDLDNHLLILDERAQRDHRKIGKELDLFTFSKETGPGLPLWLPKGAILRNELENFIKKAEIKRGYNHVYTPILGTKQLYETSGHWDHYGDDMFAPIVMDKETFVLRPMCCPHHAMVYKDSPKSYKDLPYRIAEIGGMHRYEASGALTGLERVRFMNLNDAHIFSTIDQIKSEFKSVIELVNYAVKVLELEVNYYRLSLRDPYNKEKYYDDNNMWNKAEDILRNVLTEEKIDFIEAKDEAAFYGPKLDIQIKTALNHDITLATIQLDFLLADKFDLTYIGEDGNKHRPVVIHRGIISTMERMVATLIEQYKGAFPVWLSPNQVTIIPVFNQNHLKYTKALKTKLQDLDIRVYLDDRDEKINKKIREAQTSKTPYTLIIGDDEIESKTVTYRPYATTDNTNITIDEFINKITEEIRNKVGNKK